MNALWIISALVAFMSLVFIRIVKTYDMGRNLAITAIVFISFALVLLFILTTLNFTSLAEAVNPDYLVLILLAPIVPVIVGILLFIGLATYVLTTDPESPGLVRDYRLVDYKIHSIYWSFFCSVIILLITQAYVIL